MDNTVENKKYRFIVAGWGPRTLAFLIDVAIFIGLIFLLNLGVEPLLELILGPDKREAIDSSEEGILRFGYLINAISGLVSGLLVYFLVPLYFKNGKTLGKKLLKIKVVNKNGSKLTNLKIFTRFIIGIWGVEYVFSLFAVFIPLAISCLFSFVNQYHQALHDILVNTVVVEDEEVLVEFAQKEENKITDEENKPVDVRVER
ncbi:MAG: RDD family protein [Erysipelotrichales bacterium]|nr:RDD family protein [Erysipelotrichales bacterium]